MSTRSRSLVPLVVVVAFLMVGVSACSGGGPASVANVGDDPSAEGTEAIDDEEPCAATAKVNDTSYHVVRAVSEDYRVKPTVQLEGEATNCAGGDAQPMTFHAIPQVDPAWALCGLVDGRWRVFYSDQLGQVPADSVLAHIVVGQ